MRPTVSVHPVHWRMVPVIVIVVIIISVMVIVAAAAATAAAHLPTVAGAGATPPLPYGLRVTWGIVSTVPHEIRIQNYDPQSTLSLLDGVVATCEEGTRDNIKVRGYQCWRRRGPSKNTLPSMASFRNRGPQQCSFPVAQLTSFESCQCFGGQPGLPEIGKVAKIRRLAVLVAQHGKHELRWESAPQQLRNVLQQFMAMLLHQSPGRVRQTVTGME